MGQEIVYCFKCQKRILGAEFGKGLAFQIGSHISCSDCATHLLETLPPDEKEQLLAKMVKGAPERPPGTSSALKTMPAAPSGSTRRIPIQAPPPESSSPALLIGILAGACAAVVLLIVFLSGGSSPAPAPPPVQKSQVRKPEPPPPRPEESPEEKRKARTAEAAVRKARDFAQSHGSDLNGQAGAWRAALADAEGTGYEKEVRREIERVAGLLKDAFAKDLEAFEAKLKPLTSAENFKAAFELIEAARKQRSDPDWGVLVERRLAELRESVARIFEELKTRAAKGTKAEKSAAKERVARWKLPEYAKDLDDALQGAWSPIWDGKTTEFINPGQWYVQDGVLTRPAGAKEGGAAQSKASFGDGEFRVRFAVDDCSSFWVNVRQAAGGNRIGMWRADLKTLGTSEHEIVVTCRGDSVTALLDGKTPMKVEPYGKQEPKGRFQFNSNEGSVRILAIEFRDLPN